MGLDFHHTPNMASMNHTACYKVHLVLKTMTLGGVTYKESGLDWVACLNQTTIFEWWAVRCISKTNTIKTRA